MLIERIGNEYKARLENPISSQKSPPINLSRSYSLWNSNKMRRTKHHLKLERFDLFSPHFVLLRNVLQRLRSCTLVLLLSKVVTPSSRVIKCRMLNRERRFNYFNLSRFHICIQSRIVHFKILLKMEAGNFSRGVIGV